METPPAHDSSSRRLTVTPALSTVVDCQSALVWLPPGSLEAVCFQAACDACAAGSGLARQGWRLPQIGELVDFLIEADSSGIGLSPAVATPVWSATRAPLAAEEALRVAVWGPHGVQVAVREPGEPALVWLVRRAD